MTAIGNRKETDGCYINKIPHIGPFPWVSGPEVLSCIALEAALWVAVTKREKQDWAD